MAMFAERLNSRCGSNGLFYPNHLGSAMGELLLGLSKYFVMYNGDRPHQALGNKTPDEVYQSASGGGAEQLHET